MSVNPPTPLDTEYERGVPYKNKRNETLWKYKRVCKCGDEKWVTTKPVKGAMCKKCRLEERFSTQGHIAKKKEEDKIRYYYFCPYCPSIRVSAIKRKSNLCADCSRKYSGNGRDGTKETYDKLRKEKEMPKVRYFRICPDCPLDSNTRQVQTLAEAGIKLCPKHQRREKARSDKLARLPLGPRRTKKPSQHAIDKAREINQQHREAIEEAEINRKDIPEQKMSDEEMIAQFYASGKRPSVEIDPNEPMPVLVGVMKGSGSSILD